MDPIVHAKQKVIGRQAVEIADALEKRLGLETRLHRLCIENLDQPECAIGVYTPRGHLIGEIDVRLNVADCKAKVTSALFRDLEDKVDNWTFDLVGKADRKPGIVVQDETASAELFVPVVMECRNESCGETRWVAIRPEATKCRACGVEASIVWCRLTCPNSECLADSWDPRFDPEFRRICPRCGTAGKPVARPKSHRMRCANLGCATREWDGDGHEVEMCPGCHQRGTPVEDDMAAQEKPRPWKGKMFCMNPTCGWTEWEGDEHKHPLCPVCCGEGQSVETLGFTEKCDIEKRKPK